MLIRTIAQLEAEGRVVSILHGEALALRLLTKRDGLGFSVSEARVRAGYSSVLWYKNQWEANYIYAGRGSLEDVTTGERWELESGVLYCVGPGDRHRLISTNEEGIRIISVFNPAIEGDETHDDDGAYPPTGEIPAGKDRMFVKTLEEVRAAGLEFVREDGGVRVARFLIAADHLGFALSDVRFRAGVEIERWYKHHWQANWVLDGTLAVTDHATGEIHTVGPGTLYCVGPKDRHRLGAVTDVHVLSVFNPPLRGNEVHDEDGAYPPTGAVPSGLRP